MCQKLRQEIPGFVTVDNPAIFIDALMQNSQKITKLLPACFVLSGGGTPVRKQETNEFEGQLPFVERQDYEVVIVLPHQPDEQNYMKTDWNASKFMLEVVYSLHGWKPELQAYSRKMYYQGREAADYNPAWAAYPLLFTVQRSLTDAEKC